MALRRRAAGGGRRGGRDAGLRLQRAGDTRAGAPVPGRVRRLAARRPLRAEGQLQPRGGRGRPFGRRTGGRQLRRRDRGGPARRVRPRGRRLHGRGKDPGRDRPGGGAGGQGDQRGIGRRAGAHRGRRPAAGGHRAGRPPRQPRRRRRQPPPRLHRPQPAQVRGRDRRRAGDRPRRRPPRRAPLRRAPRPRRLADARARAAAAGGGGGGRPGARAGRRRRGAAASRPRRRTGHRLRRGRRRAAAHGGRLRGGARRGRAAVWVGADSSSRAARSSVRPGSWWPRWST